MEVVISAALNTGGLANIANIASIANKVTTGI
jgi:hypothetical protein